MIEVGWINFYATRSNAVSRSSKAGLNVFFDLKKDENEPLIDHLLEIERALARAQKLGLK